MKIAIHKTGMGFTKHWIAYCKKNHIDYKLVDCFQNDIIEQLDDCTILMWHHDLLQVKDNLAAKKLLTAVEHSGKTVFPSIYENWHYDDKIAQKYLLEAIKAPLIPTYIFYNKQEALEWVAQTELPKVFKLKGGAGSINVHLIKTKKEAKKFVNQAFGKGFSPVPRNYHVKEAIRKFKSKEIGIVTVLKRVYRYFVPPEAVKHFIDTKEKNYVYAQDFIPDNDFDYRILVINQDKVYGMKRFNRKDDFKASGSGNFEHLNPNNVHLEMLRIALKTAKYLKMNSVAYDFVLDANNKPLIIEITYAYGMKSSKSKGFWNKNLVWKEETIRTMDWIMEDLIERIEQ